MKRQRLILLFTVLVILFVFSLLPPCVASEIMPNTYSAQAPKGFHGIEWLEDIDAIDNKIEIQELNDKVTMFSIKADNLQYDHGRLTVDKISYITVDGKFSAGLMIVFGNNKAEKLLREATKQYGLISALPKKEEKIHGYWEEEDVVIIYSHRTKQEIASLMISYKSKLHEINSILD